MAAQITVPEAGALTEQQRQFVSSYIQSIGNVAQATKEAGFADKNYGYRLLTFPHIQACIQAERGRIIQTEFGTLGLAGLRKVLTDPETPSHVLLGASKYALGLAGHCEPASDSQDESKSKPLSEMTLDELKDYVAKGKVVLDAIPRAQAVAIEAETSPPVAPASVASAD